MPSASAQLGKPEGLYYKSWAVVIGVEHYLLAPPIPGTIADAKTVAQAFRQMGFDEVVEVYDKDASFRHLQQLLSDMLPRKVGRMDRLVLFYAGHTGVTQDADGKDLGYLVPVDAQLNNVAKSITFDQLKDFTRRLAAKHILLILDSAVRGWETTAPQQLSLEGRMSPESETERRAMQVITAGDKGEVSKRVGDTSLFVKSLLAGLQGAADLNKNGWLMASELGAYLEKEIPGVTQGQQHPVSARLDGDGDTILIEGRKAASVLGSGPQTPEERRQAVVEPLHRRPAAADLALVVVNGDEQTPRGAHERDDIFKRLPHGAGVVQHSPRVDNVECTQAAEEGLVED